MRIIRIWSLPDLFSIVFVSEAFFTTPDFQQRIFRHRNLSSLKFLSRVFPVPSRDPCFYLPVGIFGGKSHYKFHIFFLFKWVYYITFCQSVKPYLQIKSISVYYDILMWFRRVPPYYTIILQVCQVIYFFFFAWHCVCFVVKSALCEWESFAFGCIGISVYYDILI